MQKRLRGKLAITLSAPNGVEHKVWPREEAARMAGVTKDAVKKWHQRGEVPKPIFFVHDRPFYTRGQIRIMAKLSEYRNMQKRVRTEIWNRRVAGVQAYMKRTWEDGC